MLGWFHYYNPFPFTKFTPGSGKPNARHTWGGAKDEALVRQHFDEVKAWSDANGVPVLLGEFGANGTCEQASREKYHSFIARGELRGIPTPLCTQNSTHTHPPISQISLSPFLPSPRITLCCAAALCRGFAFTVWCDGFGEDAPEKKSVHLRRAGAWDEPIRDALLAAFEPEPQGVASGAAGGKNGGGGGGGRKMGAANEVEVIRGRLVNMKAKADPLDATLVKWDNGKVGILVEEQGQEREQAQQGLVRLTDDGTISLDGDGGPSSQFHPMTPREDGSARMVSVAHRKKRWALGSGPRGGLGLAEGAGLQGRWRMLNESGEFVPF